MNKNHNELYLHPKLNFYDFECFHINPKGKKVAAKPFYTATQDKTSLLVNCSYFKTLYNMKFINENGAVTNKLKYGTPAIEHQHVDLDNILKREFKIHEKYDFKTALSIKELVESFDTDTNGGIFLNGLSVWKELGEDKVIHALDKLAPTKNFKYFRNDLSNTFKDLSPATELKVKTSHEKELPHVVDTLIEQLSSKIFEEDNEDIIIAAIKILKESYPKQFEFVSIERSDIKRILIKNLAFKQLLQPNQNRNFGLLTLGDNKNPLDISFISQNSRQFVTHSQSVMLKLTKKDRSLNVSWQALIDFSFKLLRFESPLNYRDLKHVFIGITKGYQCVDKSDVAQMITLLTTSGENWKKEIRRMIVRSAESYHNTSEDFKAAIVFNALFTLRSELNPGDVSSIISATENSWSSCNIKPLEEVLTELKSQRMTLAQAAKKLSNADYMNIKVKMTQQNGFFHLTLDSGLGPVTLHLLI